MMGQTRSCFQVRPTGEMLRSLGFSALFELRSIDSSKNNKQFLSRSRTSNGYFSISTGSCVTSNWFACDLTPNPGPENAPYHQI